MLSKRLKQMRKEKKLSQEDLAARLSVVRQTISKWEKGFSAPDADMLLKLAEVLDVPVIELLDENTNTLEGKQIMKYDVIIIGAGPGGIFSAYELTQLKPDLKVAVFEAGHALNKRHCPIDGEKIKSCIGCKSCSIMSGFGGAGAFSDGKYNITNDFGGTLYEYIGKKQALDLMHYVDKINMRYGGEGTKLYSTAGTRFKTVCIQNDLHLLDASVRHLGTDINYVVLENLYAYLQDKVDFFFDTPVLTVAAVEGGYEVKCQDAAYSCTDCIISVGRSGSKWMETVCRDLEIPTKSNRVDIGVRVELPAAVFAHLTDELYESKIVYRTQKYGDKVRTFCMNPKGAVVNENTNGIITVNGHSYEDPAKQTENTNFALLVAKHFSEPFKDSNGYGESIARLSNMLGGGVIVQRFGDLIRGRRSTPSRMQEAFITPTLNATPGDLSLVLPKRILDGIIEMIYALDKVAPGTANDDTLLYGVEVKFYNMEVEVNEKLESRYKGLYIIGDGSGITHSLSHASASGVHVARNIVNA
ncbi:MAG: helix-turn-helix domain-containing protein [Oscillospiraceae bacterium]|nr:helix-turn-helix domain-containing protein [Oscillospiraceae bacterium]